MKSNISSTVRSLIAAPLEQAGFEIWDIRFEKEGRDYNLVIELDHGDGMDLARCECANNIINPLIDAADPIESAYYIEVSSAGIDRALKRTSHFLHAAKANAHVSVKLFTPYDGKKELEGRLIAADNDSADIQTDDGSIHLNRKNIAKIIATYN